MEQLLMVTKDFHIRTKDFSVSGEYFFLQKNNEFGFLETQPQPDLNKLPDYYKTEDYISHTNSKRNLFELAYHIIRRIAIKKKIDLVESVSLSKGNLLDVGCGTGDFLKAALRNDWKVTGIEPNLHARTIANQKIYQAVFDVDELDKFETHSFDIITLWHVLEHLPNIKDQIFKFKNLLKESGKLIVAVPNYESFDAIYYKEFWAGYDVPRHLWHFNQNSIKLLFNSFDMEVEFIQPMKFDSYYVSLLSEKYKSGWLNFFNAFRIGLLSNFKAKDSGKYSSLIYVIKNMKR